jgi:hypothetical protein
MILAIWDKVFKTFIKKGDRLLFYLHKVGLMNQAPTRKYKSSIKNGGFDKSNPYTIFKKVACPL